MKRIFCIAPPSLALALAAGAHARPEIGPGGFSGSETRINFDSLSGGGSITTGEVVENQYLGVGIRFYNANYQNLANNSPSSSFGGHTLPNAVFVPQGGGGTPGVSRLSIEFTVPVNRVGMFVCGSANVSYFLAVYDATGLLETLTKVGNPVSSGTATYVGLERPELITRAELYCMRTGNQFLFNYFMDDVQFEAVGGGGCYANCDGSTATPLLTANDFQCFINKFASGHFYANCDGSLGTPQLTANDFQCFINEYAGGC